MKKLLISGLIVVAGFTAYANDFYFPQFGGSSGSTEDTVARNTANTAIADSTIAKTKADANTIEIPKKLDKTADKATNADVTAGTTGKWVDAEQLKANSGGVKDAVPTAASTNAVESKGIKTELDKKLDKPAGITQGFLPYVDATTNAIEWKAPASAAPRTSFQATPSDTDIVSEKLVSDQLGLKVDKPIGSTQGFIGVVDATGNNIEYLAPAAGAVIDAALSATSENSVQNKAIDVELKKKVNKPVGSTQGFLSVVNAAGDDVEYIAAPAIDASLDSTSTKAVENKVIDTALKTKVNKPVAITQGFIPTVDATGNDVEYIAPKAADTVLDDTSKNALENKVINTELKKRNKAKTIVRADAVIDVLPTALEFPNPLNGDSTTIILNNGASEFYDYKTGAWVKSGSSSAIDVTGQPVSPYSATYAGLQPVPADASATVKYNTVQTADDIGTGTAQAPQYPAGIYLPDAAFANWEFAVGLNTDLVELTDAQIQDKLSAVFGLTSGKQLFDREQILKGVTLDHPDTAPDYTIGKAQSIENLDIWLKSKNYNKHIHSQSDFDYKQYVIDHKIPEGVAVRVINVNSEFGIDIIVDGSKPTDIKSIQGSYSSTTGATFRLGVNQAAMISHDSAKTYVTLSPSRDRGYFPTKALLKAIPSNGVMSGDFATFGTNFYVWDGLSTKPESDYVIIPANNPPAGRWETTESFNLLLSPLPNIAEIKKVKKPVEGNLVLNHAEGVWYLFHTDADKGETADDGTAGYWIPAIVGRSTGSTFTGYSLIDTTGKTYTASSEYTSGGVTSAAADAFDLERVTKGWASALHADLDNDFDTVSVDLGIAEVVNKYSFFRSLSQEGGWGNDTYSPKDWEFWGSNDGNNWVLLDTRINQLIAGNSTKAEFVFDNNIAYRHYKFDKIKGQNNRYNQITEIELYRAIRSRDHGYFDSNALLAAVVSRSNGDFATAGNDFFIYRETSTKAASGSVIVPDDSPATGRWVKSGGTEALPDYPLGLAPVVDTSYIALAPTGTANEKANKRYIVKAKSNAAIPDPLTKTWWDNAANMEVIGRYTATGSKFAHASDGGTRILNTNDISNSEVIQLIIAEGRSKTFWFMHPPANLTLFNDLTGGLVTRSDEAGKVIIQVQGASILTLTKSGNAGEITIVKSDQSGNNFTHQVATQMYWGTRPLSTKKGETVFDLENHRLYESNGDDTFTQVQKSRFAEFMTLEVKAPKSVWHWDKFTEKFKAYEIEATRSYTGATYPTEKRDNEFLFSVDNNIIVYEKDSLRNVMSDTSFHAKDLVLNVLAPSKLYKWDTDTSTFLTEAVVVGEDNLSLVSARMIALMGHRSAGQYFDTGWSSKWSYTKIGKPIAGNSFDYILTEGVWELEMNLVQVESTDWMAGYWEANGSKVGNTGTTDVPNNSAIGPVPARAFIEVPAGQTRTVKFRIKDAGTPQKDAPSTGGCTFYIKKLR